nr:histidine kinase [Actinokineospora pegani]
MFLPVVALGGVLVVAIDSREWWHVVVLGLGAAAAMVSFVRWAAGDVLSVALPCLVVGAGVWVVGALAVDSDSAYFGLAVVASLSIPPLPRHRTAMAVGVPLFVLAVGVARLLTAQGAAQDGDLVQYAVIPTGITAVMIGVMFPNKRFYDVVQDLEDSRDREAELAVARERVRFASDLHDIQGHTLHVVKLKVALAQKLLHSDIGRVEEELREVHALVADTIAQTKELAYAQRRLNLSAELENAKNLFEAAGIDVRVDRRAEVDSAAGELFGQVLRETTTNILRHAQATQVRITLAESGISIVNDGAQEAGRLSGLAALRERLTAAGGELTAEQVGGRFLTAAEFPPRPATTGRGRR